MPEERQPQREASGTSFLRTAAQSIGLFIGIQFLVRQFVNGGFAKNDTKEQVAATSTGSIPAFNARPSLNEITGQYNHVPQSIAPIWPSNASVDISMYVSPSLIMPSLKHVPYETLVLHENNIKLDNWSDTRDVHSSFTVPREVQNNGTLWAHIYVALAGSPSDPAEGHYDPSQAYHFVRPLNQYLLKKKARKARNLLSSSDEDVELEEDDDVPDRSISSYFHPNFTLSFVPDAGPQSYVKMHPAARAWVQLESTGARDVSGQNGWYYPILYLNSFWQLRTHMTELNSTVKDLPINIHLNLLSHWKFSLMSSMDFGMKENQRKLAAGETLPGGGDGTELEEIKRILLDSNVYLLSTTVVVGILHTILEMLAFGSDVSHWRNKKDNVGVSVRTILANVFMQTIIFLYLLDNNENTSWMIYMTQGMGIVLEAWKVTKTVNVRVRPTPPDSKAFPWRYLPYTVVFEDKHTLSETELKTQEYDAIAFKYMYWVALPLLAAYAAYSLVYDTHKSWYSFIITTLVGSVYAYGFLMMVPALYINYRLQSVAHMPGKTMMYKVLNTFIDDLFAFTVKMPILHRLATFRDDIVFFVYLYQGWAYRIDYTRVNEFGQGGDDEDVADKLANKPLEAPVEGKTGDRPAGGAADEKAAATLSGNDRGKAKKRR
ncbi:MAG: hypothetical protein Q9162_005371 [Coniocarpon cinnabarinum]